MNTLSYLIRQATELDLQDAIEIEIEAFTPDGTAESEKVIRSRLAAFPEGFLVLQIGNTIIGYASSEKWLQDRNPILDESASNTHTPEGRVFCISSFAIKSSYQKNGFGLAMLDRLIEIARSHHCTEIVLSTHYAQEFYSKRGFKLARHHIDVGLKLSVMKLTLARS